MLVLNHLVPVRVRFAVSASGVQIRGVAVKQRVLAVVKPNDIGGWTVFDLNPDEPGGDLGEMVYSGDDTRHPGPAGILAIGPPPERRCLGKPGAGPFKRGRFRTGDTAR